MSFHFRPQALVDLQNLLEHIAAENPRAALGMHDNILATCTILSENPYIAAELKGMTLAGIRRFPITNYPRYSIFYQTTDNHVEIIRVGFGGRDWEHII